MTLTRRRSLTLALAAGLAPLAPALALAETAAPAAAPGDFSLGDPAARVTVVEYASLTCPHCARFHVESFGNLRRDYIETGKVRFTLREVYFDRFGLWAAMMARCGGEPRYFGIVGLLFEKQQEWLGSGDPSAVVDNLKTIGRSVGMTDAEIDACMQDQAAAEALVAQFQTNATADGVEGTPTLFINGRKHGNMGWDDLKALLDAELAKG
jgi:protein-disulfide isomerase